MTLPTPQQAVSAGLRTSGSILQFAFAPSVGIAARDINKLGLDIQNFREPLERCITEVMIPSFAQNFAAEGRPEKWDPLADATIKIREREGQGSGPILNRTGALEQAATSRDIWTVTDTAATIQSLPQHVWYGNIHQAGAAGTKTRSVADVDKALREALRTGKRVSASRTSQEIPQRQFIMMQEEDEDAIEDIFVEWLTEKSRGAGFN
jgi:phage gpG-like protein